MEKIVFDAVGLTTARDEQIIIEALKEIGVHEVTCKSRTGKVMIFFEPSVVRFAEIRKKVDSLGYKSIEPKTTDG
ncbi:MAG: hypothetical protein FWB74_04275 [Defluviitaleaceae bacterium]|nr:hypothetical protein [Defluviitaleaceae bacterium]